MVCRAEYEEPGISIIRQTNSIQNQMQAFLITNDPLLPISFHKKPEATQDNRISKEKKELTIV